MGPISPEDLRFNKFGLSQQESRVLALAMTGRIDKQIATEMGISLGTVRVYWKRIRQKVGGTRSEVIAELARNSLKLDFDGARSEVMQLTRQLEECAARESTLRVYEAAFESVPVALAILDGPEGQVVRANRAFAELHGYSADELANTSAKDLTEAKEFTKFVSQARKAIAERRAFEGTSTRRRKDGTTFTSRAVISGGGTSNWFLVVDRG